MTAEPDKFEEAIAWFLARIPLTAEQAAALDTDAQERSFWVGAGLQLTQVQRVFDEIDRAIESGEPFEEWRKRVRGELTNDAHAETVFRNATQRAYNAGRYEQLHDPAVLPFRPYFMHDSVLDSGTTQQCRDLNGIVLPASDPHWQTHWPPGHHACRRSVRSLRKAEAERRGIAPQAPEVEVPEGWGLAPPLQPVWQPDAATHDRVLHGELVRKSGDRKAPTQTLPTLVGK